ncbi:MULTISPECIES: hypothetical protein [Actinomadura]|uniref:Uncharacterized protein n=1 Tax=Actinomadura yumaensis TaxID=111807 RepID=A0ABW2CET0_9ACTN|nr:hypothetical protein [Actinomadura sp. J1-007]MWK34458.1 hypothetical protein [Actinomadura sp. J1-007]
MLAEASPVGDTYLLIIGPIVVALAIVLWITMTIRAAKRRARADKARDTLPHRGPVQGGVIEGSPSQRRPS